jgi:hypothetical protein
VWAINASSALIVVLWVSRSTITIVLAGTSVVTPAP